jgi:type I restriction enzyme, S subunit
MTSWTEQNLGELCSLITDGKHGDCRNEDRSGYYFISCKDVKDGRLNYDNARQIMRSDFAETHRRTGLQPGDILLTNSGTIGRLAIAPDHEQTQRTTFQKSVAILKPIHEQITSHFLYYALAAENARLINSAGGAVQKNLLLGELRRFSIRVPSLAEQSAITSVLGAYDDLIENNRRRIQLLEQAARLLYKEWFVHLRFPGREHVKIVDGVPEGWGLCSVADVCLEFLDGDWIESKDQGGGDFRLLQISNIGDNDFVETGNFRYVTAETFRRLRCNEVVPGDILISRMPKPIGRAWYVQEKPWRMVTAVDVTIARPNTDMVDPFYFLYHLNSPSHIAHCELRATGATRPRVSRKNMGALPILRPPLRLQKLFGELAAGINRQRYLLTRASDNLEIARDLLLPRLMNGEVVV